ncbi:hypothetical protein BBOV_III011715 [Babesia bovis T2Bo]|uniref:hypothetical protein n=1 Tax=Babesia bovis T2Bo TaxID=484906 RepID=UPI001C3449BF|nr:hypothetical protein BBOV_III011715 [Babesia bovis T2Bo]KAG6440013.1 hypothetical protein BBOV_III011715 [Babesia bovis T2Bo]
MSSIDSRASSISMDERICPSMTIDEASGVKADIKTCSSRSASSERVSSASCTAKCTAEKPSEPSVTSEYRRVRKPPGGESSIIFG